MPHQITMPKLSDSMEEGRIVRWLKKVGDKVAEGDILAEIESDKAVMELESFYVGTIRELRHEPDQVVPVGEVIAVIAEADESAAAKQPGPEPAPAAPGPPSAARAAAQRVADEPRLPATPEGARHPARRILASPLARTLAEQKGVDLSNVKGSGPSGRIVKRDVLAELQKTPRKAEPAGPAPVGLPPTLRDEVEREELAKVQARLDRGAEVLLRKHGIDPALIRGTGPGGQITGDDILEKLKEMLAPPAPPVKHYDEELPPIRVEEGEAVVEPVSFWQLASARRTAASKHSIPHFYLTKAVNASRLLKLKDEKKEQLHATVTHFIIRACVKALQKHPQANWSYDHGKVVKWRKIHVGLAVQAEAGLTVAVLRDADDMDLKKIVESVAPLVDRARTGKLSPKERLNPTFTISNMGMFDVESFMAIINPPSAGTLAVASILPTPIATPMRHLEIADMLRLTLSADHRIVDGVLAAALMGEMKRLLENPEELL